jgi:hypothetical protein
VTVKVSDGTGASGSVTFLWSIVSKLLRH